MSTSQSLFAIVIGINDYGGPDNLRFAVSDAKRVYAFVRDKLNVPEENVRLFLDRDATHDNIVGAIRTHFTLNAAVKKGDPMLFYYAGHGTRYLTPDDWPTDDGECEALCPATRSEGDGGGSESEAEFTDILDRTLGALFGEAAQAKGDNLTVIMDCCNSGSSTRGVQEDDEAEGLHTRLVDPLQSPARRGAMFKEALRLSQSLLDEGAHRGSGGFRGGLRHVDSASHVLLAACRQDERAAEWAKKQAGVFTESLLQALGTLDLSRMTYTTLRDALDLPPKLKGRQTPQCEGRNRDRILFNGKALGVNIRLAPLTVGAQEDKLRIEFGAIHGVIPGSEFEIRSTQFHSSNEVLGHAVAKEVHGVFSYLQTVNMTSTPPLGSYAMVTFWANKNNPFKISFSSPADYRQEFIEEQLVELNSGTDRKDVDVHIVSTKAEQADVILTISEDIVLTRQDRLVKQADCPRDLRLPLGDNHDAWDVLNMVARFNFHLYRENDGHPFRDRITSTLVRLSPDEERLLEENFIHDGAARVKYDEDARYALTLYNDTDTNLWCSLYYFDPADYSVSELYTPPSADMLPPLRKHGKIVFGHGSTDVEPLRFVLGDEETRDAGFVKVFLSTEFADLRMVAQTEGFTYAEPSQKRGGALPQGGEWETLTIIVDVHRD